EAARGYFAEAIGLARELGDPCDTVAAQPDPRLADGRGARGGMSSITTTRLPIRPFGVHPNCGHPAQAYTTLPKASPPGFDPDPLPHPPRHRR
ncbi:MAG: hypothetical protein ABR885_17730, partial [Mycobacterium sp.]